MAPKKHASTEAPTVLLAWIGATDLRAAKLFPDKFPEKTGLGPIAYVASKRPFERISLLFNYLNDNGGKYVEWLKKHTGAEIDFTPYPLKNPTDHGVIYKLVDGHIHAILAKTPNAKLTYHLSPGTPAMAAIWLLLSQTAHPARLISSSLNTKVEDVEVPFRIAMEVMSKAYHEADSTLGNLTEARSPDSSAFDSIIHHGQNMVKVINRAKRVALSDVTVLLLGESGTGKELFAKAIHNSALRRKGRFVAINCGAIPQGLLESQLFGHEKDAFTGANKRHKGFFEQANGGTIFLDEIGELPKNAQIRLLRVLQSQKVCRLGAEDEISVDVRIIAATHRELTVLVRDGSFREDLYFRLAVAVLRLPPLRERPSGFPLLLDHMLSRVQRELRDHPNVGKLTLSPEARRLLYSHGWPGNIRELYNVLMRAALWSDGPTIDSEDIREALLETPKYPNDIFNRSVVNGFDIRALHDEISAHYIRRTLKQTGGRKTKTATLLGLRSGGVLNDWMQRCGVLDSEFI